MSKSTDDAKKKFDLLEQPFLTLTVKAYRTHDPETGRGVCWFGFADDGADVTDDDGNDIGSCGGRMGGVYCFSRADTPRSEGFWAIPVQELWYAFQEALEARLATGIGATGVRHPDNPCDDFDPGNPLEGGDGDCDGDGHYFCDACTKLRVPDDEEEEEGDEEDAEEEEDKEEEDEGADDLEVGGEDEDGELLEDEGEDDSPSFGWAAQAMPPPCLGANRDLPEPTGDYQTAEGRWVAYMPDGQPLRPGDLPYFGMVVDDTVYHGGGPTRMPWSEEYEVLKEYGSHTNDEADEADLEDQFMHEFPPLKGGPEDVARRGAAWISPYGDLFPCGHMDHTGLAIRIAAEEDLLQANEDEPWGRGGKKAVSDDNLLNVGWVRLYVDLVGYRDELTQRQIDALWDISQAIRQDPGPHNRQLLKAIEREMKETES